MLGKLLFERCHLYFGIAQTAIPPTPRTQTGSLGHFFSGAILPFYIIAIFFAFIYHLLWISVPNPPGKGRTPSKSIECPLELGKVFSKNVPQTIQARV